MGRLRKNPRLCRGLFISHLAAQSEELAEHFPEIIAAHNSYLRIGFPSWDNSIIAEVLS